MSANADPAASKASEKLTMISLAGNTLNSDFM
jgi:hypothetical protein